MFQNFLQGRKKVIDILSVLSDSGFWLWPQKLDLQRLNSQLQKLHIRRPPVVWFHFQILYHDIFDQALVKNLELTFTSVTRMHTTLVA